MEKLNLPPFNYQLKQTDDDTTLIFDIIRKKHLVLTPEEWVRQHVVHLLINQFNYPKSLISLETGHLFNQLQKRTDIIVYDRNGLPFLLIECKAASVALTQKTFEQVCTYNQTVKAPNICISNGIKTLCCAVNLETGEINYLKTLPDFEQKKEE